MKTVTKKVVIESLDPNFDALDDKTSPLKKSDSHYQSPRKSKERENALDTSMSAKVSDRSENIPLVRWKKRLMLGKKKSSAPAPAIGGRSDAEEDDLNMISKDIIHIHNQPKNADLAEERRLVTKYSQGTLFKKRRTRIPELSSIKKEETSSIGNMTSKSIKNYLLTNFTPRGERGMKTVEFKAHKKKFKKKSQDGNVKNVNFKMEVSSQKTEEDVQAAKRRKKFEENWNNKNLNSVTFKGNLKGQVIQSPLSQISSIEPHPSSLRN